MGAIDNCFLEADSLVGGGLSIYSPLDALFGEYDSKKKAIEVMAKLASEHWGAINYFVDGLRVESEAHSPFMRGLFDVEPALRSLDAEFWAKAMALTDCLEVMPAKRRAQWQELICRRRVERVDERGVRVMDENNRPVLDWIPSFERDTVWTTITDLLNSRQKFLGERVSGLFDRLSGTHVTNSPSGFNQRMIIDRVFDQYDLMNSSVTNHIHDLRCVVAKFMGRDEPYSRATDASLSALVREKKFGEWHFLDAGAMRLKVFKKGTIHFEVNPEIAFRLNQILAWMFPLAIPAQFRQKPAKVLKDFEMKKHVLSFKVLAELERMRGSHGTRSSKYDSSKFTGPNELWTDYGTTLSDEAENVLVFLGGVKTSKSCWTFDYAIKPVIEEVIRTGVIPESKSHQFYATPEKVALDAIDMAEIDGCDSFLEPSAGQGGLADYLPKDKTTCVEISQLQAKILEAKGFNVHCANFLTWKVDQKFERILMNPPFSNGRAKDHVVHASTMLEEGGILVAVLPASLRNQVIVEGFEHAWSTVYKNEFDGTGVSVAILKLSFL